MVSILIPCHNNGAWVARAIESALDQAYPVKEVVVLDDGSTDDSLAVIRAFGGRIHWESGPNRGGNAARNRLLEMARGEWIQYLDADDCLLPGKVADQLALIDEGTDAVYGSVTLEWWEGGRKRRSEVSVPDPQQDVYAHWLNWQLAQTGAVLWRASALRRIGGWNEAYPCCQDNELTLRALENGLVFRRSTDAGAVYRIWSDATVSRKDPLRLIRTKTGLIERMLEWLESRSLQRAGHRAIAAHAFFGMARTLAGHDLDAACAYARAHRERGLFACPRDAAPLPYRILYAAFGFRTAERVAALRRVRLKPA